MSRAYRGGPVASMVVAVDRIANRVDNRRDITRIRAKSWTRTSRRPGRC